MKSELHNNKANAIILECKYILTALGAEHGTMWAKDVLEQRTSYNK